MLMGGYLAPALVVHRIVMILDLDYVDHCKQVLLSAFRGG